MDREKREWEDWLRIKMPGVMALIKTQRAEKGDEHVNECWRRGVRNGEPGWFFAREGALALGVPADWWAWPELKDVPGAASKPMLVLRDREVTSG